MKDQEESRVLSLGHQEDSSLVDIIAAGVAMPVVRRKEVLEHLLLPRLNTSRCEGEHPKGHLKSSWSNMPSGLTENLRKL